MFTKKIEDQFSADLLNTVRGILGEAKKCKDCGCSKCKCEDEEDEKDEMKEANLTGLPKSTAEKNKQYIEITHLLGHKRRVPVHPTNAYKALNRYRNDPSTKSARIVSEDLEQIDELKKEEAELEESKILDAHFEKQTPKVQGHLNALLRRGHTYPEAVKKVKAATPLGEEVEQIDEVSKKTLKNYLNKRSVQTTQSKLVGANLRHAMSHDVGLRGTKPLISPETTKELEKVSKQALDFSTKKGKSIELARKKIGVASDYRKKLKVPAKEVVEQIDELSKKTLGSYIKKAASDLPRRGISAQSDFHAGNSDHALKSLDKIAKRQKNIGKATDKLTKEEQEFIDALNDADIDQIDEISAEKLVRYKDAAYKDSHKREKGISRALSKLVGGAKTKVWSDGRKNPVKEEVELEEGRGRPPKEGSAAWKARQNQANDDMTALGVQLRKAKSMNKKVRFMDGKEHEIHPSHADRFEDHMAARKTSQDKAAFQKQAHKSHADFVKAVSAPVPKASKDTGEIVKYRH